MNNRQRPKRDVFVREVGLRDGLQNVATFFPTAAKTAWITEEYHAGVREIQVCSFVPEKVFAQFRDSAEVVGQALGLEGLEVSAFVPNLQGAKRALEAGVPLLHHVVSASEGHNQRNLKRSAADSMADFQAIAELRRSRSDWQGVRLGGYVGTAFGCSIDGPTDPDVVVRLADRYVELGADELIVADTVGYANPKQVKSMFLQLGSRWSGITPSAHFHDTRGLGLANVLAALDAGVRRFDSSLAGLGGCPSAPGATGNVVTEDLVFLLESMGMSTGIDIEHLIGVREILKRELPQEPLRGSIAKAGLPKGFIERSSSTTATNQPG